MSDLRVLSINHGSDLAGAGWLFAEGFRRHPQPGIVYESTAPRQNHLRWPVDLPWHQRRQAWRTTDVLHLHNHYLAHTRLTPRRPPVPTVIHYHGSYYRANQAGAMAEQRKRGAVGAVSTLDLWLTEPDELTWLPQCHDLQALAAMRGRRDRRRRLRIGHAPTNRTVKSTEAFLEQASSLPGVEVVLIEGKSWADCLALKATCDVLFDQAMLGYGNNAVEAWAMGIPVVAGAAPGTLDEYHRRFGYVPFVQVTPTTIRDGLELLLDEEQRDYWGQVGHEHVATWHDEYPVRVASWLYHRAAGGGQWLEPPPLVVGVGLISSNGDGGSGSLTPSSSGVPTPVA